MSAWRKGKIELLSAFYSPELCTILVPIDEGLTWLETPDNINRRQLKTYGHYRLSVNGEQKFSDNWSILIVREPQ